MGGSDDPLQEANKKAYDQLARRARTRREMVTYLQRKGYEAGVIESVVSGLEGRGFINDAAYAADFAELRLKHHPEGRSAVIRALMKRGIDADTAETAMDGAFAGVDELELARRILRKRGRRPADDTEKEKRRIAAYLQRRGISSGTIYRIIDGEFE